MLNLLISGISAKSAAQTLSVKGECTFLLFHFLVIGMCNSSTTSSLFLIPLPEVFYQKVYRPLKQFDVDNCHIMDL